MQSGVLGELGVKGDTQHGVLSNAYDPPLAGGNRLHSRPSSSTHGARMKTPGKTPMPSFPGRRSSTAASKLCTWRPKALRPHRYVQGSKEWLLPFGGTGGQHDETGASPQDRVVGHEGAQAGAKPTGFHKLAYGRAFSPGMMSPSRPARSAGRRTSTAWRPDAQACGCVLERRPAGQGQPIFSGTSPAVDRSSGATMLDQVLLGDGGDL